MTEGKISLDIRKALEQLGIPAYRMQAFGYRGRIRGCKPGTPDILTLPQIRRNGQESPWPTPFWIEVKKPGGKLTQEQLEFSTRVRLRGEYWICAESVDDVLRELKEVGAR